MTARAIKRCALLTAALSVTAVGLGDGEIDGELILRVKAGYIINFCKFTTWPAAAFERDDQALTLAVLDDPPLAEVLEAAVRGKQVNGRPLVVVRLATPADGKLQRLFESAEPRHLLYVSDRARAGWPALRPGLAGRSTVTVSDIPGFIEQGGMLGLVLRNSRVAFEVGMDAVKSADLKLDSRLLSLAARVERNP
ncbi:MAG: YfiR family protein [Planctomycetota bacterium]